MTALLSPPRDDAPPANLEAEQALLAGLLAENRAYEGLVEYLLPHHFADPAHGRIYEACQRQIERGQQANSITLRNLFERDGDLADVGGAEYLAHLQASYVSTDVGHYGALIYDLYLRRRLIEATARMQVNSRNVSLDASAKDIIETGLADLYEIGEGSDFAEAKGPVHAADATEQFLEHLELTLKHGGHPFAVPTGYASMDEALGGFLPSDLYIIAGRPGMMKTGLALNIAARAAKAGKWVAYWSLEMAIKQIMSRLVATELRLYKELIDKGQLNETDVQRVMEVAAEIRNWPLHLDDSGDLTPERLRSRCLMLKRKGMLDLVIVDYLQLMRTTRPLDNRVQEVTELSRSLKRLAMDLEVPVIALSQLNRELEKRDDTRPQLSDLRESGAIEQDASVVLMTWWPAKILNRHEPVQRDNETPDKFFERLDRFKGRLESYGNKFVVFVRKNRHGAEPEIDLQVNASHQRLYEDGED